MSEMSEISGLLETVVPLDEAAEIRIEYLDNSGIRRSESLTRPTTFPYELAAPARSLRSWKGQRNNTGWWWFATTGMPQPVAVLRDSAARVVCHLAHPISRFGPLLSQREPGVGHPVKMAGAVVQGTQGVADGVRCHPPVPG